MHKSSNKGRKGGGDEEKGAGTKLSILGGRVGGSGNWKVATHNIGRQSAVTHYVLGISDFTATAPTMLYIYVSHPPRVCIDLRFPREGNNYCLYGVKMRPICLPALTSVPTDRRERAGNRFQTRPFLLVLAFAHVFLHSTRVGCVNFVGLIHVPRV